MKYYFELHNRKDPDTVWLIAADTPFAVFRRTKERKIPNSFNTVMPFEIDHPKSPFRFSRKENEAFNSAMRELGVNMDGPIFGGLLENFSK